MCFSLGFDNALRWVFNRSSLVFTKVPFTGFHRFSAVFALGFSNGFRWVFAMDSAGFSAGFLEACSSMWIRRTVALRWKIPCESRFSVWLMDRVHYTILHYIIYYRIL